MSPRKSAAEAVRTIKPSEQKALDKKRAEAGPQIRSVSTAPVPYKNDDRGSKSRPISEFPDLVDVLPDLATRSRDLAASIKAMEAERKELGDQIGVLLRAAECDSIEGDSWCAIRAKGKSTKIDPKLLLAHGVAMEVIEGSTVVNEYYYVQVRSVGERNGHGGN